MRLFITILFLCLGIAHSQAQQSVAPVRQAVEAWLQVQSQGLPGKVSFEIGYLDAANQLAPCKSFDISRPPGARAWGHTNVVVRCLGEAGWRIYLPVTIRVQATYLMSARPIGQGQVIEAADLTTQTGDLSDLPTNILTEPELAIGKAAVTGIAAGRPLRADMLRAQIAIRQGQTVKVLSRGPGFAVTNEGRALNTATEGQVAQVRLGNGQIVSGIARPGGSVEISY